MTEAVEPTVPLDLFVIEAPGKAKTLKGVLAALGHETKVIATKGHLMELPGELKEPAVDSTFRDFGRRPRDQVVYDRLVAAASEARNVYIATDADQEGDVIAWDVAEAIAHLHPAPLRIRLRGIDEEAVSDALNDAKPVSKGDAIPGRTRAIIDRLIGITFSKDGIAVGRVSTALLGAVAISKPTPLRLRLVAPAVDGGRPWVAETDIKPPLTRAIADRLSSLDLPAISMTGSTPPAPAAAANMGEIMIRAGDLLDIGPKDASKALQSLYECGRMTYPRSSTRQIGNSAAKKIGKHFRSSGIRFDDREVPEKPKDAVHDAPHPIGKFDPGSDPRKLGVEEGIRTMVGRDLVRCGQRHSKETADASKLAAFLRTKGFSEDIARTVAELPWTRENGPRYPGQETWPDGMVIDRRPDTVLLEVAMKHGLGRPSTWANHIDQFMSRNLVDADLSLTQKGRDWMAGSPRELLDPRISAAIERTCERGAEIVAETADREAWEILAERIVSALPPAVRAPLVGTVKDIGPQPRPDPAQFRTIAPRLPEIAEPEFDGPVYAPPQD